MPEGPEVKILSQYLASKIKGKIFQSLEILGGKYKRLGIENLEEIQNKNFKIKEVDSKGKLMWIKLVDNNNNQIYLTSHLGLTGFWSFEEDENDKIQINIKDKNKNYKLCYQDPRNFGNINIYTKNELNEKLELLADDVLNKSFTEEDFENKVKKYLNVSSQRKNQIIFKILMKQEKKDGLVSGLGNYLVPEILYNCKISPTRKIGTLTTNEIHELSKSIKYITKLSYYNNDTGYMTNFDKFVEKHKKGIDKGIYPEFHTDTVLLKTDKFEFKVYQQKKDPDGNPVEANKTINEGRTTYWVPSVQK